MDERTIRPESDRLDSPQTQAKAENLVRQARLASSRGQKEIARKLLQEASEVAPNSPEVISALAEAEYAQSHFKTARDLYKRAAETDPANPHYERMYGECVLRVTEIENPALFVASPEFESFASGKKAIYISLFLPGVGQIVTGKQRTGIAMLACWIIGLVLLLVIPNGLAGVFGILGIKKNGAIMPFNPFMLLPIGMIFVAIIWSVADAAQSSPSAVSRTVEKPVPPVDKPFEI